MIINKLTILDSKLYTTFPQFMRKLFQNLKSRLNKKNLISPRITKGIMKSSKQKQKIYNKFLKSRTKKIEVIYKAYKNLVKAVRKN